MKGRPLVIVGVLLIALGALALAYQGFTYTTRETVVDLPGVQVQADKKNTVPLPPILGGAAIVGGVVLLVFGSRGQA